MTEASAVVMVPAMRPDDSMIDSRSISRREAAWAIRWMSRGWGLVLLLTYAGMTISEIMAMLYTGRLRGLDRQLMFNVVFTLQISSLALVVGIWMYFLSRRSFAPFRPDRLGDLLVSPLRVRDLWPGMLAGPAVIVAGFALIAQLLNLLVPILAGEWHYLVYSYLRSPDGLSPEQQLWIRIVTVARVPLMVLVAATLSTSYGALAAVCVLPRGGSGRLVVVLSAAQVILIPEIATALWVDNSAVMSNAVAERFQLVSDHITGPLMTLILAAMVYGVSLRLLRGRSFHERLLRSVEQPQ